MTRAEGGGEPESADYVKAARAYLRDGERRQAYQVLLEAGHGSQREGRRTLLTPSSGA